MFKRKKKKTGVQTPEFRKPTPPPPPPTSGSNAFKPNSVSVLPNHISTVTIICQYETPCGWCTKWDKKCDKKIGCCKGSELDDIRSGKGLSRLDTTLDPNKPLPSGLRKEIRG